MDALQSLDKKLVFRYIHRSSHYRTQFNQERNTLREGPLPWALAVAPYTLLIIAIVVDWGDGSGYELIHPIANGVIGNGSVLAVILWKKR